MPCGEIKEEAAGESAAGGHSLQGMPARAYAMIGQPCGTRTQPSISTRALRLITARVTAHWPST